LVAPRGVFNLSGDIRQQMHERPFVRYNASMPIGTMIAQHLRRLGIDLPAPYSFDATRSVFAMMIRRRGWTITTPLCVLDASRDLAQIDCLRLPFAGFERTIRVASWRDELGSLPGHFADMVRTQVQQQLLPEVRQLADWLGQEFATLDSSGAVLSPPLASARRADES
jgi:hypothetical protein